MNAMADRTLAAELSHLVDNLGSQQDKGSKLIGSSDAGSEPAHLHNGWCREGGPPGCGSLDVTFGGLMKTP